jgi:hypothetical protein
MRKRTEYSGKVQNIGSISRFTSYRESSKVYLRGNRARFDDGNGGRRRRVCCGDEFQTVGSKNHLSWQRRTDHFNEDVTEAKADLEALNNQTPRPADYDKQVAAIRTRIINDRASIDFAGKLAKVEIALLEFKPSNRDEGLPLPQFVKDLVKAKGISLTNNISTGAPDVEWNWKTNTFGKLIVKFNISTK